MFYFDAFLAWGSAAPLGKPSNRAPSARTIHAPARIAALHRRRIGGAVSDRAHHGAELGSHLGEALPLHPKAQHPDAEGVHPTQRVLHVGVVARGADEPVQEPVVLLRPVAYSSDAVSSTEISSTSPGVARCAAGMRRRHRAPDEARKQLGHPADGPRTPGCLDAATPSRARRRRASRNDVRPTS